MPQLNRLYARDVWTLPTTLWGELELFERFMSPKTRIWLEAHTHPTARSSLA